MTKKEYKIIDSIQRACTEDWGLETDVLSTKEHFGTEQDMELPGQWVWVCRLKVTHSLSSTNRKLMLP